MYEVVVAGAKRNRLSAGLRAACVLRSPLLEQAAVVAATAEEVWADTRPIHFKLSAFNHLSNHASISARISGV